MERCSPNRISTGHLTARCFGVCFRIRRTSTQQSPSRRGSDSRRRSLAPCTSHAAVIRVLAVPPKTKLTSYGPGLPQECCMNEQEYYWSSPAIASGDHCVPVLYHNTLIHTCIAPALFADFEIRITDSIRVLGIKSHEQAQRRYGLLP
jgi:hypothetical protein